MRLPDPAQDPGYYADLASKRFLAWVVDVVVTLIALVAVLILTLFIAAFIFPLIWMALAIAYRYVMILRFDATLGMMLAGLRLRRLTGARPDPGTVLAHAAIYAVAMATLIGQIASVALILTTPYRQGINDLVLGTTMVHRDPDHD
jgi:uncharacterized RDD family membrane protein YckC